MVATVLILLTTDYSVALFCLPVALILCREIGVSALREWMAERGKRNEVKVGLVGKVKTTVQMIATVLLLLVFPGQSADIDLCQIFHLSKPLVFTTGLGALYASTALALFSGWQYLKAALPTFVDKEPSGCSEFYKDPDGSDQHNILQ